MLRYTFDFGLQAIVDEHTVEAAQQQAAQAPQPVGSPSSLDPASQQAASQSLSSPAAAPSAAAAANASPVATPTAAAAAAVAAAAATPAAAMPSATPVPASLLRHTQAANLLTGSPLAATPASRAQTGSSGRQAGAPPSADRPPAAVGMHAPSQATQNTEVTLQSVLSPALEGARGERLGLESCSSTAAQAWALMQALPVGVVCVRTAVLTRLNHLADTTIWASDQTGWKGYSCMVYGACIAVCMCDFRLPSKVVCCPLFCHACDV